MCNLHRVWKSSSMFKMSILIFSLVLLAPYLVACASEKQLSRAENQNLTNLQIDKTESQIDTETSSVGKVIELPHSPPDFPAGPGKEIFLSRCGVCHSLRYVTVQPSFPKKTWAKEVDKMIKTYGAHINKKEAAEITEYLFSIKGKPDKMENH